MKIPRYSANAVPYRRAGTETANRLGKLPWVGRGVDRPAGTIEFGWCEAWISLTFSAISINEPCQRLMLVWLVRKDDSRSVSNGAVQAVTS